MVKNVTGMKSGIMINVSVSVKIQKNIMYGKKSYTWIPATCCCENDKYIASIIDDSVIVMNL